MKRIGLESTNVMIFFWPNIMIDAGTSLKSKVFTKTEVISATPSALSKQVNLHGRLPALNGVPKLIKF